MSGRRVIVPLLAAAALAVVALPANAAVTPLPSIFTVAADAAAGGDTDNGIGAWLQETVRSAFGWLQGWVSAGEGASERETAGGSPEAPSAPAKADRDAEP